MNFINISKKFISYKSMPIPGDPPGIIQHKKDAIPPSIKTYYYDHSSLKTLDYLPPCQELPQDKKVWISINGHGDTDLFTQLEKDYGIHLLTLEDVINSTQLPKVEEYDNYLFFVGRIPSIHEAGETEQIILILFENVIISIQEWEHDYLEPIHKRLLKGKPRIRSNVDYMAYAIIDLMVDSFFPIIEKDNTRIERIEETIFETPNIEIGKEAISFKRKCSHFRRTLFLTYEAVLKLNRGGFTQISDNVSPYLRDCADHANQAMAGFETLNNRLSDILNLQISLSGARLNEVMKYLTLIATIFIPLTFIAGIYGMNFNNDISPLNMPELNWSYGYPMIWGIMIALVVVQVIIFKNKGWLGSKKMKDFDEED